jgi:hypothetical protein
MGFARGKVGGITTASESDKLNIFLVFQILFALLRRVAAPTKASSRQNPLDEEERNVQERTAKRTAKNAAFSRSPSLVFNDDQECSEFTIATFKN